MNQKFDIIIVGGGPVGASLACALRGSALRVAVIEARPRASEVPPSDNERTLALAFGARRIFEAIGVWSEIERLGANPIERIHVSQRGRFGATRLAAADIGLPALGYVVENRVLGAALAQCLRDARNVSWFCPATVEDVRFHDATAQLTVQQDGRDHALTARLVVGADGAHSAVRRLSGIVAERRDYAQVAVVATVATSLPHQNTAYERFTDSGPLAALPMHAGRCAIIWSTRAADAEAMLAWSDAEYLARLQQRFGDRLGRFASPGARVQYPLALTQVGEAVRPRLVLIGNAAHTLHPVAGQGFNLGLRDVAALAEVLVTASAHEDIGTDAVLQRYGAWRARDTRATEMFTDGLIRLFSNELTPLALARGVGLVAVDVLPPLKRRLLSMTS